MAYELKPNTFSLFRNKDRKTDKHPNATGTGRIECPHCGQYADYFFDAWTNETRDGDKYQSGKVKPKNAVPVREQRQVPPKGVERGGSMSDALEEEIPFAPEWRG
jgi:adenine-specific DNA methylase